MEGLYDGRDKKCPICGNKIIHPHIGCLTEEEEIDNWNSCQWIEVVDEGRSTIGYHIICKRNWPSYKEAIYGE